MLQAHSLLWHYLWIAPNVLLLSLAWMLWRRGTNRVYPAFFAFALIGAIAELVCYAADVARWVGPRTWWYIFWAALLVEGLLKFAVIGEIFGHAFRDFDSIARLGKTLIRGLGAVLIFVSALAAAFAPQDGRFGIVSGAHLLEQTIYLVETGLFLFIFLFSGYFRLRLSRPIFGMSLGLAFSAAVHLAFWGLIANGGLPNATRYRLEFLIMGTYHFVVLLWIYYLLLPTKVQLTPMTALPENNLAVWNRELERLLHL